MLRMSNNELVGSLPTVWPPNMVELSLTNDTLTGSIPQVAASPALPCAASEAGKWRTGGVGEGEGGAECVVADEP